MPPVEILDPDHGSVRVVSKRAGGTKALPGEVVVDISRTSILGNPEPMVDEADRARVINVYRVWLDKQRRENTPAWQLVVELARRVRAGERLALQCWCAPCSCHGDVIVRAIRYINAKVVSQDPVPRDGTVQRRRP